LAAKEVRELLDGRWAPPGVCLPQQPLDGETVAAIIRITGGNFRLLNRLLPIRTRPMPPRLTAELVQEEHEKTHASRGRSDSDFWLVSACTSPGASVSRNSRQNF
jgi:hypothetical protein